MSVREHNTHLLILHDLWFYLDFLLRFLNIGIFSVRYNLLLRV
jgi:hypothetical protein